MMLVSWWAIPGVFLQIATYLQKFFQLSLAAANNAARAAKFLKDGPSDGLSTGISDQFWTFGDSRPALRTRLSGSRRDVPAA